MVATKVLISMCLFGTAVRAAPQLGVPVTAFGAPAAAPNQNAIVTNVVSALQPQIADAVAAALRGLSFSTGATSTAVNTASTNSRLSSFGSSSSSATGATGSAVRNTVQQEEITVRPNYAYEFKVADDDEQTYISHNEARDGDDVTGTYSYIDPTGALITVNYQAGVMGYTQTVDKQEGAVQIRSKAGSSSSSSSSASNAASNFNSGSSSSSSSAFGASTNFGSSSNSNRFTSSNSAFNSGATTSTTTGSSAAALDQSALITQIITALQPQISSAVNSAIGSTSTTTNVVRTVAAAPSFAPAPVAQAVVAGDRLTPLFGN